MTDFDIQAWDKIAKAYDDFISKGDIFREKLLDKTLLELIGDVKGKRILEAGCGQGYFTKILSKHGGKTIGVDGSHELIKIAKQRYPENSLLKFLNLNLKDPLPFPDSSFDLVISNMTLMDFNPIDKTIKEISRVLSEKGIFVFSILHPLFSSGKLHKTISEKILHKIPHYKITSYKTPFKRNWRIRGLPVDTNTYHRPMEYYSKLLNDNSFLIKDLREPVFDKEFVKDKNNFLKLCAEIPHFLIIKALKITIT